MAALPTLGGQLRNHAGSTPAVICRTSTLARFRSQLRSGWLARFRWTSSANGVRRRIWERGHPGRPELQWRKFGNGNALKIT
jgi:hypothetical protein